MRANRAWICVYGGTRDEVEAAVNAELSEAEDAVELAAVEYNYQAPEFDGATQAAEATHGVLLVFGTPEPEEA